MNDALAEAMRAAGYQQVVRPLQTEPIDEKPAVVDLMPLRENAELRKQVAELKRTIERLRAELAEARSNVQLSPISLKTIIEETARKHGVSVADIKGDKRHRHVMLPRQEFFWRACHESTRSTTEIGRFCGNRDHSTVIHGREKHQDRIDRGEVAA